MNIAKWLPKQNNDMNKIFTQTRNIERELRILGKKFATNINYKNPDFYVSRANRERENENWNKSSNVI